MTCKDDLRLEDEYSWPAEGVHVGGLTDRSRLYYLVLDFEVFQAFKSACNATTEFSSVFSGHI